MQAATSTALAWHREIQLICRALVRRDDNSNEGALTETKPQLHSLNQHHLGANR